MTAQSKANIAAATQAVLIPERNGYRVDLIGKSGKSCAVENAAGAIVYSSMAIAKAAVKNHNSALTPGLKPTI